MKKHGVLIVDDQYIPREMFSIYVEKNEAYEVVACISSAAFAPVYVQDSAVELVIMDILMADGSNGLEAAAEIKRIRPGVKIIAVTSMIEEAWLKRAKSIGIESFWYKEASEETLLSVMDKTMAGISVYPEKAPEISIGLAKSSEFTGRELEVLRAMTVGATNQEIANELGISEGTVKVHIKHMIEKTGCSNRTQLAIRARVSGLVVGD